MSVSRARPGNNISEAKLDVIEFHRRRWCAARLRAMLVDRATFCLAGAFDDRASSLISLCLAMAVTKESHANSNL